MPGAPSARLNYASRRLRVRWSDEAFDRGGRRDAARCGYRVRPFEFGDRGERGPGYAKFLLRCLAVAGFAAMNVMLLSVAIWAGDARDRSGDARPFSLDLGADRAAGGALRRPAVLSQRAERRERRSLNMDVPISLGVSLALGLSVFETARHAEHAYFDSALMLMFFLLAGRVLDGGMRRKTRAVAANLASLRAAARRSWDPRALVEDPARRCALATAFSRAGERLPADGASPPGRP